MNDIFERKQEYMSMAQLGVAAYIKATQPSLDRIKQREAYRWMKALGHKPALLDRMESEGLIKGIREGQGKNSPIYYSRLEIQLALQAIKNI